MTAGTPAVGASFGGEPAARTEGLVTLVTGATFCLSGRTGDISPDAAQGFFFRDTRLLSLWALRVRGRALQVLSVTRDEPYRATFLSRLVPEGAETEVLLERVRYVGDGMREDLRVRNLGREPVTLALSLSVGADFADLFAVKEGRLALDRSARVQVERDGLLLGDPSAPGPSYARVTAPGANCSPGGLQFEVELGPRSEWGSTVLVGPGVNGQDVPGSFELDVPLAAAAPARQLHRWRSTAPRIETGHPGLARTLLRSLEDLGSLRIVDPEHPGEVAVAAGSPWFMALFGRDSLLSSYMALPLDPDLAMGTLAALARYQGAAVDPLTEEQPGRILHERRLGVDFPLARGGGHVYYGTADATPLFVMLLGELRRWGHGGEGLDRLLPHADRALEWVEHYGDRDRDGFVEYAATSEHGLRNQGWKDSWDGVSFADGRLAEPPIALAEVQGYVYGAYVARAHLAHETDDEVTARRYWEKATRLKEAFNEAFWLPDRGYYAVALDRDKQPVDGLASNMGHCLWTGIIDPEKAASVAAHLVSPEMFTGWGVRTLATSMARYNPMSYHNGSVWPHDNALIAHGLMRYGFVDEARSIATGLLAAAERLDGALPELFCGFTRDEYAAPVPYPTSCAPQAWAAATPVHLVRTLLRLDPFLSRKRVWFAPVWPDRYGSLRITNLPLAGRRAEVTVGSDGVHLHGLDQDVEVVRAPREPLAVPV